MRREGYSPDTIKNGVKVLRRISFSPVPFRMGRLSRTMLPDLRPKGSTKLSIVNIYYQFAKWKGFTWVRPKVWNSESETRFIPLESDLKRS